MSAPRRWTADEDAIIRDHYSGEGAEATARLLKGRTPQAVITRAKRLGIIRDGYHKQERKLWTWREDEILRDLWPTTSAARIVEMGALPGRTADDMRRRASKLKVRRLRSWEVAERRQAEDMEWGAPAHLWTAADERLLRAVMEAYPQGITYTQARALGWHFSTARPRAAVSAADVAERIRELYERDMAERLQATACETF